MATSYKTPGVYVVEKNAFPNSAVPVATSIPVFIGYTEKAVRNNESILKIPTRITSMKEYEEYFGGGFKSKFTIREVADKANDVGSDDDAVKGNIQEALNANKAFNFVSRLNSALVAIVEAKGTGKLNESSYLVEDANASKSNVGNETGESGSEARANVAVPEGTTGTTTPEEGKAKLDQEAKDYGSYEQTIASAIETRDAVKQEIDAFKNSSADNKKPLFDKLIEVAEKGKEALAENFTFLWKEVMKKSNDLAVDFKLHTIKLSGKDYAIDINDNHSLYFYNAIRLFYANGGSTCYILSIGNYGNKEKQEVKYEDYVGTSFDVFDLLKTEFEPTLVVIPDASRLDDGEYNTLNEQVLRHCSDMGSRFGLFDVKRTDTSTKNRNGVDSNDITNDAENFRKGIGINNLRYGAAYYPWLKTSVVQPSEISFDNLDSSNLSWKLNGDSAYNPSYLGQIIKDPTRPDSDKKNQVIAQILNDDGNLPIEAPLDKLPENKKIILHQSLTAASPAYVQIMTKIRSYLNELPPSSAMAGVYTYVDNSRGVWKAPANVSLSMVNEPSFNVTDENQGDLNVDAITGKSINVVRSFPGLGTLVWGARTLDGNSQDWRYINVRRTLIMIEQSLKLATRAYIFEPNDSGTWVTVKSMYDNFLYNLWRQGALFGATPEQAYNAQLGLGVTMTPNDILDGLMRISVKVAIVRPAEFIEITFQQQLQQA